jgi:hypothetical protein
MYFLQKKKKRLINANSQFSYVAYTNICCKSIDTWSHFFLAYYYTVTYQKIFHTKSADSDCGFRVKTLCSPVVNTNVLEELVASILCIEVSDCMVSQPRRLQSEY